ncbi:MAG: lamin tail domain-containing protein [Patescibacteria group bacterium]|jgi:hypothetical protein
MRQRSRFAIPTVSILVLATFLIGATAAAQTADLEQNPSVCSCTCADATVVGEPAATETTSENIATPTETTTTTTADAAAITSPSTLRISELLPDPVGRDTDGEFIELENYGTTDANLADCLLRIPGKHDYTLPEITLAARSFHYFLFAETGLTLTNSGGMLELSCAENQLARVSYSGPVEDGSAYAIDASGIWSWTTGPTPGQANVFPVAAAPPTEQTAAAAPEATPVAAETIETTASAATDRTTADVATPDPPPAEVTVAINEFLPDPIGSDDLEWIELRNDGEYPVDLAGWQLDDAEGGSRPYVFPATTVIADHGLLLVARSSSGLALNNNGDQVRLFNAAGQMVSAATYDQAQEGDSFAWSGQIWVWSEPTPGLPNSAVVMTAAATADPEAVVSTTEETSASDDEPAAPPPLTIADAVALAESDQVLVRGVVNISPGAISKTIFGIQDPDGSAGLTVRLYGTPERPPAVGDEVELTGRLTTGSPGPRLSVSAKTGLKVIRPGMTLEPRVVGSADLPDLDGPLLVNISGEVSKIGSTWFKLIDESGETELMVRYAKTSPAPRLNLNDRIELTGVFRNRSASPELFLTRSPRLLPAPVIAEPEKETARAADALNINLSPAVELPAIRAANWLWPLAATAAGAAVAGGAYLIRRRKYQFSEELAADIDK